MMATRLRIFANAILLFVVALPAYAAATQTAVNVGDDPPDFLGKDAHGDPVLVSNHSGKLVIVSFFASWCGPCRKEIPMLAAIQKTLGREKLVVVTVNYKEDRSVVKQLRRTLKDYEVTITHDYKGTIGESYGVNGIPHMIIVGKNGKVAAKHVGYGESSLVKVVDDINRLARASE